MRYFPERISEFAAVAPARTKNGQPVQRFRKTIIREGEFYKASRDQNFKVTNRMLHHWVDTFDQMREDGIKVPIPSTHEGAYDPDLNRGYVLSMFVQDDQLVMMCDMIGEDGIKAASRSDVSIFSPPKFTAGNKKTYKQPICHVALCTDPVVPGLGDFVAIAASHSKGGHIMDWDLIGKAIGLSPGELTGKNAEELLLSGVNKLKGRIKKLKAKGANPTYQASHEGKEDDSEPKGKKKNTAKEKEDDDTDPTPAPKSKTSKAAGAKVAPYLLKLASENRSLKLHSLLEAGCITPDQKSKLEDKYIGEDGEALELTLSQETDDGFDDVINILASGKQLSFSERTGPQLMSMSDSRKKGGKGSDDGDDDNDDTALVKSARRLAAVASGKK